MVIAILLNFILPIQTRIGMHDANHQQRKTDFKMLRFKNSGKFYYFHTSVDLYNSEFYNINCDVERFIGLSEYGKQIWVME